MPLKITVIDLFVISLAPIRFPHTIVTTDTKIIRIILEAGIYTKMMSNNNSKLTIKVKGISTVVININAIRPEAITPMMQPIMIAPRRFEIDS